MASSGRGPCPNGNLSCSSEAFFFVTVSPFVESDLAELYSPITYSLRVANRVMGRRDDLDRLPSCLLPLWFRQALYASASNGSRITTRIYFKLFILRISLPGNIRRMTDEFMFSAIPISLDDVPSFSSSRISNLFTPSVSLSPVYLMFLPLGQH